MSTNPTKIFDLYPQKGTIAVGADASLIVVNPDHILDNWTNKLVSNTDWNAYTNLPAIFPEKVLNRGELIY